MSQLDVTLVNDPSNPGFDVVFIHGLGGSAQETWTSKNGEFWPEWLAEAYPTARILAVSYPTPYVLSIKQKEMDLYKRARNVLEALVAEGVGQRPLVFICHSLGGLVTKALLLRSGDSNKAIYKRLSDNARLVVFLGTPHTGAALAAIASRVAPLFTSKTVSVLGDQQGVLTDIKQRYKSFCESHSYIENVVYYETIAQLANVIVVDQESSDPGLANCDPVPIDKNHIDLAKPLGKNDLVYKAISIHISEAVPQGALTNDGFAPITYEEQSVTDRRTLLQKLIAAKRESEFMSANPAQSTFARSYHESGLHQTRRQLHDDLLSDIHQRFDTHVYHPLICKKAEANEINEALQEKVITPIEKKWGGTKGISSTLILQAVYFLAEQCHIRWDAPK